MKIETDRLILREMNENDYNALYAVLADSDIIFVKIIKEKDMRKKRQLQ